MTTAEMMALAVLQGDLVAAKVLADHLLEYEHVGFSLMVPCKQVVDCTPEQIRVVLFASNNVTFGSEEYMARTYRQVANWVRGEQPTLMLNGIDRVELWVMPKQELINVTQTTVRNRHLPECRRVYHDSGNAHVECAAGCPVLADEITPLARLRHTGLRRHHPNCNTEPHRRCVPGCPILQSNQEFNDENMVLPRQEVSDQERRDHLDGR